MLAKILSCMGRHYNHQFLLCILVLSYTKLTKPVWSIHPSSLQKTFTLSGNLQNIAENFL